jgi:hypothetical protein
MIGWVLKVILFDIACVIDHFEINWLSCSDCSIMGYHEEIVDSVALI